MTPEVVQHSSDSVMRPPQVNRPPRIVANRRQLDDRFPVLGFNLYYDRPGFGEVILTTDRSLFNPANSGRRNPSNFYSSRQDSKLVPSQFGTAVYIAPAAVLRGYAHAVPRPTEIFYTLVVYASPDGKDPVFAQPPDSLGTSAPAVTLSPHFGSDGVHEVLGMSPDRLQRFHPATAQSWATAAAARVSPEEDRGEGEDGTSAPPWSPPPLARAAAYEIDDGNYNPHPIAEQASDPGYDDGYTGPPPEHSDLMMAVAQQLSFRPGETEPTVLEDGETEDGYASYRAERSQPSTAAALARDDDDDDDGESYRSMRSSSGGGSDSGASRRIYAASSTAAASFSDGYDDDAEPGSGSAPVMAAAYGDESPAEAGEPAYQSLSFSAAAPAAPPAIPLTIEGKRDLIGKLGDYTGINADGEFNGVLGTDHPAYQRYHLGLSFGVALFNQDAGHLGHLLTSMRHRDAAQFDRIFGADAEAVLRLTNAQGPSSAESSDGRSARVQKIGNRDLWEEPWLTRFREAGGHKAFQAVQNRVAAKLFLDPMLQFAEWMGLTTERGLAILMDRAATLGVQPACQWVANCIGPFQTPPQRHEALAALKFDSIRAFQSANPGVETNGQWGPLTHAAAVGALRARGGSPVPLPTTEQMLDALVRRSAQTPWLARIVALRNDARLSDVPYQIMRERHE